MPAEVEEFKEWKSAWMAGPFGSLPTSPTRRLDMTYDK